MLKSLRVGFFRLWKARKEIVAFLLEVKDTFEDREVTTEEISRIVYRVRDLLLALRIFG